MRHLALLQRLALLLDGQIWPVALGAPEAAAHDAQGLMSATDVQRRCVQEYARHSCPTEHRAGSQLVADTTDNAAHSEICQGVPRTDVGVKV